MRGTRTACLAAIALLLAWPLLFSIWFVERERTVYFWDYANYWLRLVDLSGQVQSSPLAGLAQALGSITTDKYNDLATLGLLPAALLAGTSRVTYVASIVAFFGWPAMALLALLLHRLCPTEGEEGGVRRWLPALIGLGVMALLPQVWFPILLGCLDIVGCIGILAIFFLLADGAPRLGRWVLVGVLLGALPLLRRWYAFFTASFYAVWGAWAVLALVLERDGGVGLLERLRRALLPLALMALATAVTLLPLFGPVGQAVFLRDHFFVQAPYRNTPGIAGALARLWSYFGGLTLVAAGVGLALALRDSAVRRLALPVAVQAVAILFAFNQIQMFGESHFYLLLPALLLFESYAIVCLLRGASAPLGLCVRAGVVLCLLTANFAAVFFPGAVSYGLGRSSALAVGLFGRVTHEPMRRTDLGEVARLARAASQALPRPDGAIYVLASSPTLNPDTLRNAHLSLPESEAVPDLRGVVRSGVHVDRRDGFPYDLLWADVVVTSEPIQTHLDPREQQVVIVPAAEIQAGSTIGRSFRALPEVFHLEHGVTARVHVRERALDPGDRSAFADRLAATHPESPDLLRPASTP